MATNLNFKWGKTLSANSPALQAGTIYVATEERAMYVDAVVKNGDASETKRIRLGDVIFYDSLDALKAAISAGDELTSSALYYLAKENALAKWDNVGKKWTIINDTTKLDEAIKENAASIQANAGDITTLKGNVKDLQDADTALSGRLDLVEASIGASGDIATRLTAAEGNITTLQGNVTSLQEKDEDLEEAIGDLQTEVGTKAAAADLTNLTNTVGTLTQTVENNRVDAENGINGVSQALEGYKTTNDAALGSLTDRVEANEEKIGDLEAADGELADEIERVEGRLADYVLLTSYNTKMSSLDSAVAEADRKGQQGITDAAAAQATANKGVADAADAAVLAQQGVDKAKAAQDTADANALAISGINTKIGTVPADKTVVQMIAEAQTAATYDDTAVRGLISDNAEDISDLQTSVGNILTGATTLDSFKDVEDKFSSLEGSISTQNSTFTQLIEAAQKAADDAQKEVDDLETVVASNKSTLDESIADLQEKDAAQDLVINSKVAQSDYDAFVKRVDEKDGAQDTLISGHTEAITNLGKEDQRLAGLISDNAEDIADLQSRLGTAEGTLKTAVETTIPAIDNRVKALEDNMDSYATDNELASVKSELEGKIKTAQDQADKGVEDAATAQAAADDAQADATDALKQLEAIKNGETLDSFKDVEDAIAAGFAANDAMVFKGVIDSEEDFPEAPQSGWTYKVTTAGPLKNKDAKVGDLFIYLVDEEAGVSEWKYIPSGNEDKDEITISSTNAEISIGSDLNVASGSVKFVSGSDSIVVDGSTANQIAISMVWGEF